MAYLPEVFETIDHYVNKGRLTLKAGEDLKKRLEKGDKSEKWTERQLVYDEMENLVNDHVKKLIETGKITVDQALPFTTHHRYILSREFFKNGELSIENFLALEIDKVLVLEHLETYIEVGGITVQQALTLTTEQSDALRKQMYLYIEEQTSPTCDNRLQDPDDIKNALREQSRSAFEKVKNHVGYVDVSVYHHSEKNSVTNKNKSEESAKIEETLRAQTAALIFLTQVVGIISEEIKKLEINNDTEFGDEVLVAFKDRVILQVEAAFKETEASSKSGVFEPLLRDLIGQIKENSKESFNAIQECATKLKNAADILKQKLENTTAADCQKHCSQITRERGIFSPIPYASASADTSLDITTNHTSSLAPSSSRRNTK